MGLFKTFFAGRTGAAPVAADKFLRLDATSTGTETSTWTQMKDDVLADVADQPGRNARPQADANPRRHPRARSLVAAARRGRADSG